MKNNYLYPETINIFNDQELEFRVSQINEEGTNVKEVFEANLVSYVHQFKQYTENWRTTDIINSEWIFNQYCNGNLQVQDDDGMGVGSPCFEFLRFELYHYLLESSSKSKIYIKFLEAYSETYKHIDRLINHYHSRTNYQDSFLVFSSTKLPKGVINYKAIEAAFFNLEKLISRTAALDLIHFLQLVKKENYEQEVNQVFDMDYFLNPVLVFDPIILMEYREIVKVWVKKIGQDLKFNLSLPFIPAIVEWITSEINNSSPSVAIEMETKDYPKYIFTNYKAFDLFHTIAKEMTTHPQISFLFRQMSEKEKPALIVVENSDFVKWFNQQNYGYTLDYTTKTYEQSKTEDRIALYNVVKNLKISA